MRTDVMRRSSHLTSATLRIASRFLAAGIQATYLVLLGRALAPSEYGTMMIYYSTMLLTSTVTGLGTSSSCLVLLPTMTQKDGKRFLTTLLLTRFSTLAVALGIIMAYTAIRSDDISALVLAGVCIAISDTMSEFVQSLLSGLSRQNYASVALILIKTTVIAVFFILQPAIFPASDAAIIASLAGVVVSLMLLSPFLKRPNWPQHWLKLSLSYWPANLAGNIRLAEPSLIGHYWSAAIAGPYAIASKLMNPLLIVVNALQSIYLPELSALKRKGLQFNQLLRRVFLVLGFYGAFLVVFSPIGTSLVITVLGDAYAPARWLILGTIISTGIAAVTGAIQIAAYAYHRPSIITIAVGVSSIIGLVVLFCLGSLEIGTESLVPLAGYPVFVQLTMCFTALALLIRLRRQIQDI